MAAENTLLGLTRDQQFALIAVAGTVVTAAGLVGSSSVDPSYDPLAFGVGVVMVAYAVVGFTYSRLHGLLVDD